ncbi:MAG: hypothetical protein D6689_20735 [Deltaproteobacteria bacterium]|nr:MAG: hypothetical protein D6689_20735 [Deltaproteobacteria bacterium]
MKTRTSIPELEVRIDPRGCEHIDAARLAATAAVARAFAASTAGRSSRAARTNAPAARRAPSRRRAPEEIAALAERLQAAVHAMPGATMAVLARQVGSTPRELGVAVAWLRRQDRIRCASTQAHEPDRRPMIAIGRGSNGDRNTSEPPRLLRDWRLLLGDRRLLVRDRLVSRRDRGFELRAAVAASDKPRRSHFRSRLDPHCFRSRNRST